MFSTEVFLAILIPFFLVTILLVPLYFAGKGAILDAKYRADSLEDLVRRGFPEENFETQFQLGQLPAQQKVEVIKGKHGYRRFKFSLEIRWKIKYALYLAKETRLDHWIRSLGMSRESILGSAEVDRLFHVVLSDEFRWQEVLRDPEVLQNLKWLGEQPGFATLELSSSMLRFEISSLQPPAVDNFEVYVQRINSILNFFAERILQKMEGPASPATKIFEKRFQYFSRSGIFFVLEGVAFLLCLANYLINFSWIRPVYMFDVYVLMGIPSLVLALGIFWALRNWIRGWQLPARAFLSLVLVNLISLSVILLSAGIYADIKLDRDPAQVLNLSLVDKQVHTHRRKGGGMSRSYHLYYQSPIKPILVNSAMIQSRVSQSEYDNSVPGRDSRAFTFHRGFLGIPWYEY